MPQMRLRKKSRQRAKVSRAIDLQGDEASYDVLAVLSKTKRPRKKRKGPEAVVLSQCLDYLHKIGVFCWRNNVGGAKVNGRFMRFGMAGSPDIIGIVNGRFFAVETKAPGGKLSDAQHAWHARAMAAGCDVLVVRSLDELVSHMESA